MAGAWHGGLEGADQYVKDNTIKVAVLRAMDYWFSRDFTNVACLDSGGTTACPCSNLDNSLWCVVIFTQVIDRRVTSHRNTNWFSNVSQFYIP